MTDHTQLRLMANDPELSVPYRRAAADAFSRLSELEGALTGFRNITPGAMVALMALGREGLLLADKLHKADDIARAALDQIKGAT